MATSYNPRRPKHNRCDFCGRNAHKVAVRFNSTLPGQHPTRGFCPSCWQDDSPYSPRQKYADTIAAGEASIVYDLRKRKDAA